MPDHPAAAPRSLTGERLLAAWEDGARCRELYRPLAVLAAAQPGTDPGALAALPIARRDLLLLRLRTLTFGAELAVFGRCAACREPLEFTLRADELTTGLAVAPDQVEWTEDGRHCRLRQATTNDLARTLAVSDPGAAAELLLGHCLEVDGVATGTVPSQADRRFAELHADTEIRCAMDCPACAAHQVLDFDIGPFLWHEVSVAARRLLTEIHLLARAYGWSEQDILALPPGRRAAYLELAGAG